MSETTPTGFTKALKFAFDMKDAIQDLEALADRLDDLANEAPSSALCFALMRAANHLRNEAVELNVTA